MKFTIPFNGQSDLIPQLRDYPQVVEIYGKLTSDFVGGGKHSFQTPSITKRNIAEAVKLAHRHGIRFNYLLNSSCLDNREWTIAGQKEITRLIDWIVGLDIDAVTIATPYLLELVKKRYPALKVCVSTLAGVNTLRKAEFWEELGASRITLLNIDVNRNLSLLEYIRKNVKCELNIILNANCLHECPFYIYHGNITSHASQSWHITKGFVIDYCRIRCRYQQLIEPVNLIRSTWVRPEDTIYYEKIGIDSFKIIDRGMTTPVILSILAAYINRRYDGNLLDLFPDPSKSIMFNRVNLFPKLRYFFHPFKVNVFKLKKFSGLFTNAIYVDNNKLDGFFEKFINLGCDKKRCPECGYCSEIAAKAVYIDKGLYKEARKHYENCLKDLISGDLFKFLKGK